MTEPEETTDAETLPVTVKRKFMRITSTMHLDWPQHSFVLRALGHGEPNDFANPEDVPLAVIRKMKGFIRSGHVKFFIATQLEGEASPTFQDVTPSEEELAEDDAEDEAIEAPAPATGGEPGLPEPTPAPTNEAAPAPATGGEPQA